VLLGTLAFASRAAAQDSPATELPSENISNSSSGPPASEVTTLAPIAVPAETADPWRYAVETRPPMRIPTRRAEFGASIDYLRLFGSAYDNLVGLWGYSGFYDTVHFSARAFAVVHRLLLIGGRVGYVHADGGLARADRETLAANAVDVSAALRVRHEFVGRRVIGRIGFDLEFGPAFGTLILRGQTDGFASMRLGGTFFAGFAPTPDSPAIVFRLGLQYLPYAGAGGSWGDPVFAGFFIGAGLEGAR
jgi:hypothetical protein